MRLQGIHELRYLRVRHPSLTPCVYIKDKHCSRITSRPPHTHLRYSAQNFNTVPDVWTAQPSKRLSQNFPKCPGQCSCLLLSEELNVWDISGFIHPYISDRHHDKMPKVDREACIFIVPSWCASDKKVGLSQGCARLLTDGLLSRTSISCSCRYWGRVEVINTIGLQIMRGCTRLRCWWRLGNRIMKEGNAVDHQSLPLSHHASPMIVPYLGVSLDFTTPIASMCIDKGHIVARLHPDHPNTLPLHHGDFRYKSWHMDSSVEQATVSEFSTEYVTPFSMLISYINALFPHRSQVVVYATFAAFRQFGQLTHLTRNLISS